MNRIKFCKIIVFAGLLFLGFYFTYKIIKKPDMQIIIKFDDVPPVLQHFPRGKVKAYYRGFDIGEVSKITLCCDQKHVLFYLDIYYKGLKLPNNSKIYLTSEDIYGTSHIAFYYPEKATSKLLKDGDTVHASGVYQRLDQFLVSQFHEGQIEKVVANLVVITGFVRNGIEHKGSNVNDLITGLQKTNNDVDSLVNNLQSLVGDREFQKNLKSGTSSAAKILTSKGLGDAPKKIDRTLSGLEELNNNLAKTNNNIPQLGENIRTVNGSIVETSQNLRVTNKKLKSLDKKIPQIPPSLLENTNRTLENANCISSELSGILSKRFLLFRLLFGNPAESLKKCK